MSLAKFGVKEVANATFYDLDNGKPVLFFDTLKVSTLENEAETANATGGIGNGNLITWNYSRKATLSIQDALLSAQSLSALSGNEVEVSDELVAYGNERVVAKTGGAHTLENKPLKDTVTVMEVVDGLLGEEFVGATTDEATGEVTGLTAEKTYRIFYKYHAPKGSKQVTFSTDKFPSAYFVVGDTIVRDQLTGKDKGAQFQIPKAQLQAGFTFTMEAENVSTFDFNLEALRDGDSTDLYRLLLLDN